MQSSMLFALALLVPIPLVNSISRSNSTDRANLEYILDNTVFHEDYSKFVRPRLNQSEPILIKLDMALFQLLELNLREQYLRISAGLRFYWRDEFLTWDEADYPGIKHITVPSGEIWTPDIVVENSLPEENNQLQMLLDGRAMIKPNGEVQLLIPQIVKASCVQDISTFPYDPQDCTVRMGSWSGDMIDLQVVKDEISTDNYVRHAEIRMDKTEAKLVRTKYSCCERLFDSIHFIMYFNRKPLHYMINLVLPSIFLASLASFVFVLPCECGEKLGFSLTLLLGMTVFQLMFSQMMPVTSDSVPLLSIYFSGLMVIMVLSTFAVVLCVWLHHANGRIRNIQVREMVSVDVFMRNEQNKRMIYDESDHARELEVPCDGVKLIGNEKADVIENKIDHETESMNAEELDVMFKELKEELRRMYYELHTANLRIKNSMEDAEQENLARSEWQAVTDITERMFFIGFTVCSIVFNTYVLL